MCGGSTNTTTQGVTIPPDVLARYDAVNAKASAAADTPFQKYEGEFVAPVNAQQQTGMSGTDKYANAAQPTYQEGIGLTRTALNQAQPYIDSATGQLIQAQDQGQAGINQAANQYGTAANRYGTAETTYGNAYSGAQPYQGAATNATFAGMQAVNPTGLGAAQIGQFMDPYLGTVVGNTAKLLNQQNQQAQAGQLGNAIRSGGFGGDRAGIAAANLAQQQGLAAGSTLGGLLSQGYGQALSAAQQQQGVSLGAAQANRAAMQQGAGQLQSIGQQGYSQGMGLGQAQQGIGGAYQGLGGAQAALGQQAYGMGSQTSQQLAALGQQQYGMTSGAANQIANLGMGAQTAGLQGAQAQLTAGQIAQQTQQAEDTAQYNQHLMEASYPFQTAQFEANVAEGTGGLSGSTTTTNQPGGFFSDRRLKENVKEIGKTFDGQPIYSYRYKDGDPRTQIGLMAQDVEKKHPDAVGSSEGYRTVDYGKATEDAADRGHFYSGGIVPASEGGHVGFEHMGEGYAGGGMPILPGLGSADMQALLQAQAQMYAPFSEVGLYGGAASGAPGGGSSYVPQANLPVTGLTTAGELPAQESALDKAKKWADLGKSAEDAWSSGKEIYDKHKASETTKSEGGLVGHYAAGGGPNTSGMPYSGAGGLDIPAGAAPPAKLETPGTAPSAGPSGLDTLSKAAGIGNAAVTAGKALAGASGVGSTVAAALPFLAALKNGGAVGHYAVGGSPDAGGMPYSGQATGLNIPDQKADVKTLDTPSSLPGQETGLDKAGKVAAIAATAAKIAAMAGMASGGVAGGRKGYALDGSVNDDTVVGGIGNDNLSVPFKQSGLAAGIASTGHNVLDFIQNAAKNYSDYNQKTTAQQNYNAALSDAARKRDWARDFGGNAPSLPPPPSGVSVPQSSFTSGFNPETLNELKGLAGSNQQHGASLSWSDLEPQARGLRIEKNPPSSGLVPAKRSAPVAPRAAPAAPAATAAPVPGLAPAAAAGTDARSEETIKDFENENRARETINRQGGIQTPPTPPTGVVPLAGHSPTGGDPGVGSVQELPTYTPQSGLDRTLGGIRAGLAPEIDAAKGFGSVIGDLGKTYLDKIKSGDPATITSLLAGIGAMGTAPTHSFGAALSAGLGTGAESYMAAKKAQAGIRQTGAETTEQNIANAKNLKIQESLGLLIPDPNGPIVDAFGNRYRPVNPNVPPVNPNVPLSTSGGMATPPVGGAVAPSTVATGTQSTKAPNAKYLGPNVLSALPQAQKNYFSDAPFGGNMNPNRVAASEAMANQIDEEGAKANSDLITYPEQAHALFSPERKGLLTQGAFAPIIEPYVAKWNAIMSATNHPEWTIPGLGDTQIAQKLQYGQAASQASESGERAYSALKDFQNLAPGPQLDPSAAATLMAQVQTNSIKDMDKRNVINEARSLGGNFELQNILTEFDKDYTPQMYNNIRDAIKNVYLSGGYNEIYSLLSSPPGSDNYKKGIATLNALGAQRGIQNFSRAFMGW